MDDLEFVWPGDDVVEDEPVVRPLHDLSVIVRERDEAIRARGLYLIALVVAGFVLLAMSTAAWVYKTRAETYERAVENIVGALEAQTVALESLESAVESQTVAIDALRTSPSGRLYGDERASMTDAPSSPATAATGAQEGSQTAPWSEGSDQ
jgi:hypothetical protein